MAEENLGKCSRQRYLSWNTACIECLMLFAFVDLFFTEVLGFLSAAQNCVSLPSLLDADFQLAFFPLCWRIKIVFRLAWGRRESL